MPRSHRMRKMVLTVQVFDGHRSRGGAGCGGCTRVAPGGEPASNNKRELREVATDAYISARKVTAEFENSATRPSPLFHPPSTPAGSSVTVPSVVSQPGRVYPLSLYSECSDAAACGLISL